MTVRSWFRGLLALTACLAIRCSGSPPAPAPEASAKDAPAPDATAQDAPDAAETDAADAPAAAADAGFIANPDTRRLAASHILVTYAGTVTAKPQISRTKEEARARAEEVRQKILGGEPLELLARAWSDDSTAPRGGRLGSFDPGTMVEPFENAVRALKVGEISPVVETPFGFHVIRREALVEIRAAHLQVSWAGAERVQPGITRSKADAQARAGEALAALQGGAEFASVVRRYSDGPLKDDGGDLGWFGRSQLAPQLDSAAFALHVGETSPIIETPSGYHVIRRTE